VGSWISHGSSPAALSTILTMTSQGSPSQGLSVPSRLCCAIAKPSCISLGSSKGFCFKTAQTARAKAGLTCSEDKRIRYLKPHEGANG
jgi:hypothetical protein